MLQHSKNGIGSSYQRILSFQPMYYGTTISKTFKVRNPLILIRDSCKVVRHEYVMMELIVCYRLEIIITCQIRVRFTH